MTVCVRVAWLWSNCWLVVVNLVSIFIMIIWLRILTTMCQVLAVWLAHFSDWNFITAIYKGFLERFDDHWEHSREVLDVTHTVTCRQRDRDGRRDNFPFRETDYVFICYRLPPSPPPVSIKLRMTQSNINLVKKMGLYWGNCRRRRQQFEDVS